MEGKEKPSVHKGILHHIQNLPLGERSGIRIGVIQDPSVKRSDFLYPPVEFAFKTASQHKPPLKEQKQAGVARMGSAEGRQTITLPAFPEKFSSEAVSRVLQPNFVEKIKEGIEDFINAALREQARAKEEERKKMKEEIARRFAEQKTSTPAAETPAPEERETRKLWRKREEKKIGEQNLAWRLFSLVPSLFFFVFRGVYRFLDNILASIHKAIQKAGEIGDVYGAAQASAPGLMTDALEGILSGLF